MKVLFLTQTSALGPSSRYRVYQFIPLLEKMGFACEVSPAIDDELYARLYLDASPRLSRRGAFTAIWQRRQADLRRVGDFDVVFVQKGFFPGLYAGFERKIAARRPLVFDFDDAVWLPREGGSQLLRAVHREGAVNAIMRRAAAVIAGNEFLAEHARKFNRNVTVAPSSLEVARYRPATGGAVIGWIGSRTTLPYLGSLRAVFEKLHVAPRVIASGDPSALGFAVEFRAWRLDTELDELAQIGIGVAPLFDTPWERGKCGVKTLQYMACGIPVVASPVGVHNQIVRHSINGFLARDDVEWFEYLTELISDEPLRRQMGQAGRDTVVKHYSLAAAADKLAAVLRSCR